MAFMVPLVKNHYDIYARNNPADHSSDTNSLYLSATSLKSGAPVKKQYRIILTGGKVVNGGGGSKKSSANSAASLTQTPSGKLYYRLPSASISLPVRPMATKGRASGALKKSAGGGSPGKSTSADNSPTSATSPSRPLPHVRRTVRNPMTNRVYSYSVSIPDYVAEEPEDLMHHESLLDPENKENGLPSGTPTLDSTTASPTPPPILPAPKKVKKQPVTASISLPSGKTATKPPPVVRQTSLKTTSHARTHSSTSTGSSGPETPSSNSREYIELLRKFILHLKMLKIGGGSGSSKKASLKTSAAKESSAVPAVVPVAVLTSENPPEATPTTEPSTEQPRARKRKDTMEDSKHL